MASKIVVPRHVAIIPDGNRRWARSHRLPVFDGHERGVGIFKDVTRHASKRGVEQLSVWGMSLDNFTKRSAREVAGLLRIFKNEFARLADDDEIHERQTRIQVFGRWREKFPRAVRSEIQRAVRSTEHYNARFLNFFLAYSGTDEMLSMVQRVAARVGAGDIRRVTARTIKNHLFTKDLPPVDLIIRTAGEPHLSAGFMMWDAADAELFFTDTYWPDFSPTEFDAALAEYSQRRRKRGG